MARRYQSEPGSLDHARALALSISRNPIQSAGVLAGLAGLATMHPLLGLASAAAGATFMAVRPGRPRYDLLGRDAEAVARTNAGFSLPLGRQIGSDRPIVLNDDEARQHLLVLGTTGAGKTEFLLGMSEAAVSQGAGLLFIDGKGDVSLFAKAWMMAERHGRLDDLLVLNLMSGSRDPHPPGETILSNTMNPFATGSASILTGLVVGMIDEFGEDGRMAKARAVALFTGLMNGLVHLRDQGRIELDVNTVRDHLDFGALHGLRSAQGMSDEARTAIDAYLTSIPGYNPERGAKQALTTMENHAGLQMLFTRILGHFADLYGHIFRTSLADVDMADVVLNRRILVVLLPALEKSGDVLGDLGKIVLATLKATMLAAMEGTASAAGDPATLRGYRSRPGAPFVCVLDEIGYYAFDGLALVSAQARSLGFCMIYAASDIPALKRLNEREAASVIANTNTKIFMRTEDIEGTDILAGAGSMSGIHPRLCEGIASGLRMEERLMVGRKDLRSMAAGEMLIMHKGERLLARCVWPGDGEARGSLRANHFVRMPLVKA